MRRVAPELRNGAIPRAGRSGRVRPGRAAAPASRLPPPADARAGARRTRRAGLAHHRHVAPMRLDDRVNDRQTEAGVNPKRGCGSCRRARNARTGARLQLGRDARAVVGTVHDRTSRLASSASATITRVPAGVWTRALASRFANTWCSRRSSPRRRPVRRETRSHSWSGPAAWASLTASMSSRDRSTSSRCRASRWRRGARAAAGPRRGRSSASPPTRCARACAHVLTEVAGEAAGELGVAADRRERGAQLVAGVGDEGAAPCCSLAAGRRGRARRGRAASFSADADLADLGVRGRCPRRAPAARAHVAAVERHPRARSRPRGDTAQRAQARRTSRNAPMIAASSERGDAPRGRRSRGSR